MKTVLKFTSIFLLIFLFFNLTNLKSQPAIKWGIQFGSSNDEYALNHVVDNDKNIYIAGKTNGAITGTNKGKNDAFLTKVDPNGKIIWTKTIGTSEEEDVQWSAIDVKGNVYVTGMTTGDLFQKNKGKEDLFVAKFSKEGDQLWGVQMGSDSTDIGKGIYVDKQGAVYVTGLTTGKFGAKMYGKTDGFLLKIDKNGHLEYINQLGTELDDFCNAIAGNDQNRIFICGSTWGLLGVKSFGMMDAFTGEFTTDGKLVRYNQLGSDGFEIPMAIKVDRDLNIYLGGTTSGDFGGKQIGEGDCFLTKLSPTGVSIWSTQFGTRNHDGIRSIDFNDQFPGKILVSGLLKLPPAEAFMRLYSDAGQLLWEKNLVTEHPQCDASGKDASIDEQGTIYQLGLTGSSLFGPSHGAHDVFLVKYSLDK